MFSFFLGAAAAFTLAALVTAAAQPAPRRYVVAISNTKAIQNLIDRTAREGGGTLVVPAGTFVTGALFFKQGVNLSIEKGGVLKGSVNPEDYPQVETRWEGTEREWTSDGIDIDSSRRVRVNNVDIDGNDDCISIKSGKDADGLQSSLPLIS